MAKVHVARTPQQQQQQSSFYTCNICGPDSSFRSIQALAGHMSAHSKASSKTKNKEGRKHASHGDEPTGKRRQQGLPVQGPAPTSEAQWEAQGLRTAPPNERAPQRLKSFPLSGATPLAPHLPLPQQMLTSLMDGLDLPPSAVFKCLQADQALNISQQLSPPLALAGAFDLWQGEPESPLPQHSSASQGWDCGPLLQANAALFSQRGSERWTEAYSSADQHLLEVGLLRRHSLQYLSARQHTVVVEDPLARPQSCSQLSAGALYSPAWHVQVPSYSAAADIAMPRRYAVDGDMGRGEVTPGHGSHVPRTPTLSVSSTTQSVRGRVPMATAPCYSDVTTGEETKPNDGAVGRRTVWGNHVYGERRSWCPHPPERLPALSAPGTLAKGNLEPEVGSSASLPAPRRHGVEQNHVLQNMSPRQRPTQEQNGDKEHNESSARAARDLAAKSALLGAFGTLLVDLNGPKESSKDSVVALSEVDLTLRL